MTTDLQRRRNEIEDITLLADIQDKVLLQQLESLSCLGISVVHQIVTKMSVKEQTEDSFERRY